MEMEQECSKGRQLSSHQLLEKSHDGPTLPDQSMLTGSHSSGGDETGGRKAVWRGDGERGGEGEWGRAGEGAPDEEYGNGRQTEKLIEDD